MKLNNSVVEQRDDRVKERKEQNVEEDIQGDLVKQGNCQNKVSALHTVSYQIKEDQIRMD